LLQISFRFWNFTVFDLEVQFEDQLYFSNSQYLFSSTGGSIGGSLGQLPPNVCGAPLNSAPLPQTRPFLVPMEVETEI